MQFLIAAISLGFLGSFHCIGMCGPIALSLPVHQESFIKKTTSIFLYNIGRATTYAIMGALFGLIGQGFSLINLQQILSITLGCMVLLAVLLPQSITSKYKIATVFYNFFAQLKNKIGKLFKQKQYSSLFSIGLLNGLLPCGLVYMAIVGAMATANVLQGAIFMAVFGLSTIPLMFSVSYFSNVISLKFRTGIRKTIPFMLSAMAVLLILRGMNLGIPYVSPKMEERTLSSNPTYPTMQCCHKK
ncbi:MAG: sulfite exporter TauE/SafE family protein [Bacteroidia bacterium]